MPSHEEHAVKVDKKKVSYEAARKIFGVFFLSSFSTIGIGTWSK